MEKNCKTCEYLIEESATWHEHICEISDWEKNPVEDPTCDISCGICFHDKTCQMGRHGTDEAPFECPRFSPKPEWLFKKENRNELL